MKSNQHAERASFIRTACLSIAILTASISVSGAAWSQAATTRSAQAHIPTSDATRHRRCSSHEGQRSHDDCEGDSSFQLTVSTTDATSVGLQWTPLATASEYAVWRDGSLAGSSVAKVGHFTDFGLRPASNYEYVVRAYDASGALIAQSSPTSARTTESTTIRTRYRVLAIAFDPDGAGVVTEATYLKHRIQFLKLASQRSAIIDLYTGGIVVSAASPPVEQGSTRVDYTSLVTDPNLPGLDGYSIVDLVEKGDIDHVWVVKSPRGADFGENTLIGNRAIQGSGVVGVNSWVPLPVKCSRSFFVNFYESDERSNDAYAHMVEGIITSISDGHPDRWPRNLRYTVYADRSNRTNEALEQRDLNVWERFRLADGWNGVAFASPGNGNAGSSHFLPTTPRTGGYDDYTYFDHTGPAWHRYADSAADDWLYYPTFGAAKRKINGYEFGAYHHYVEGQASYAAEMSAAPDAHESFRAAATSFHQWWFAHLPHNPGVTNGALDSWWPYLFDFNRFDGSMIDYPVDGFREIASNFRPARQEYGTERKSAVQWGYWHSQNGFSPGGKAGRVTAVSTSEEPQHVKAGSYAVKVRVESTQYLEWLGSGRNDVFYPVSRNAHWSLPDLSEVHFSIKPGRNPGILRGTNPILRLYKNASTHIELVPLSGGAYANLLQDDTLRDANGWYNFRVPLAGNAGWEKHVFGYVDPSLPESQRAAARAQLEREILGDLNYIEVSIRSETQTQIDPHFEVVTYFIDDIRLITGP